MRTLVLALAIFGAVVVSGCGGGGGSLLEFDLPEIPTVGSGGSLLQAEVDTSEAAVDPVEEPTDQLLLSALQQVAASVEQTETELITNCVTSSRHAPYLQWALDWYEYSIGWDQRLIGRDMPTRLIQPGTTLDVSGNRINVLTCSSLYGLPGDFNALASLNVVVMLDPLMDAICESACYWDRLREQAEQAGEELDGADLILGMGVIFRANMSGNFGTVVGEAEITERLGTSEFAFEAYWGGIAFILYHELGHANLVHGVFKSLVRIGVIQALAQAGITNPTPQEIESLNLAFAQLSRGTETQSDIYAGTLVRDAGFSVNGAAIMVMGCIGYNILYGECPADDPVTPEDELAACIFSSDPEASHPPYDIRAQIAGRVIDNGEDLTHLLYLINAFSIG